MSLLGRKHVSIVNNGASMANTQQACQTQESQ
jgi:hypothetical protein